MSAVSNRMTASGPSHLFMSFCCPAASTVGTAGPVLAGPPPGPVSPLPVSVAVVPGDPPLPEPGLAPGLVLAEEDGDGDDPFFVLLPRPPLALPFRIPVQGPWPCLSHDGG
jgi:hypothetical protein